MVYLKGNMRWLATAGKHFVPVLTAKVLAEQCGVDNLPVKKAHVGLLQLDHLFWRQHVLQVDITAYA